MYGPHDEGERDITVTKKIALVDIDTDVIVPGLDKIISFRPKGDSSVDEYLDASELDEVYDSVFHGIMDWVSSGSVDVFDFRGVNLIRPYKVHIFYHILNICQKKRAVGNIIKKEPVRTYHSD